MVLYPHVRQVVASWKTILTRTIIGLYWVISGEENTVYVDILYVPYHDSVKVIRFRLQSIDLQIEK
jgi:hypothetical protein